MNDIKDGFLHINKIMSYLKKHFDAVPTENKITVDEQNFIEKRSEMEHNEELHSLEGYMAHYEEICHYGLENVMMKKLEPYLWWMIEFHEEDFKSNRFFKQFGSHHVIQTLIKDKKHRSKFENERKEKCN